jgi:hypothetical protein
MLQNSRDKVNFNNGKEERRNIDASFEISEQKKGESGIILTKHNKLHTRAICPICPPAQ